jgi:Spy/CpxP family protein refolding chaperone
MQNKWMLMVLVVSLSMNAAFVAVAGYAYLRDPDRFRPGTRLLSERDYHFYEVLKLTPTQMKRMSPLATSFHERLNHLHAEMESRKEEMIRMLGGGKVAADRVETLRRQMAAIQDRIQKTVIAHILDVKAILDAGQRERFFDLLRDSMTRQGPMFTSMLNRKK